MSALLLLAGSLGAPPIGLLLVHPISRRFHAARRVLGLAWHLLTICLWCALAARAGHAWGHAGGWDTSRMLLVLAAGLIYVEAFFLLGIPWHERRVREEPPPPPTEPAPAGGENLEDADVPRLATAEDVLEETAPEGEAEGDLEMSGEALALLHRIQGLDRVTVDSIMTPRERIFAIDDTLPARAALERMRQVKHTRLLVVTGDSLDRILGVVHAKDLVPLLLEADPKESVRRHLRRWLRVAQGQSVARLLEEFRRGRVHIGVVGDPLGRTLGLVTLGDIFRYIAGVNAPEAQRPDSLREGA